MDGYGDKPFIEYCVLSRHPEKVILANFVKLDEYATALTRYLCAESRGKDYRVGEIGAITGIAIPMYCLSSMLTMQQGLRSRSWGTRKLSRERIRKICLED